MKYEDVMQLLHDSTQPVEFRVISGGKMKKLFLVIKILICFL